MLPNYININELLKKIKISTMVEECRNVYSKYILQVNNIRKKCEICSKFAIKTPERRH